MKKISDGQKQILIVAADVVLLWYISFFFTVASTFLNVVGVALILLLTFLTIKIFKVL